MLHPEMLSAPFEKWVIQGLPFEEYCRAEAINSHGLMKVLRSPLHYLTSFLEPEEETDAQEFGSLVHMAVLEPVRYENLVRVGPDVKTRALKAWKDFAAAAGEGCILLKPSEAAEVEAVVGELKRHPVAGPLLFGDGGMNEVSFFWTDPPKDPAGFHGGTLRWCKGRVDRALPGGANGRHILVDLKTTKNAMYDSFVRDAYRMMYDLQGAHYVAGWSARHQISPEQVDYLFVAVESEKPHAISIYNADPAFLESGAVRRNAALQRLHECISADSFPGYNAQVRPLGVPLWAKHDMVLGDDTAEVGGSKGTEE